MIKRLVLTITALLIVPFSAAVPVSVSAQNQVLDNLEAQCAKAPDSVVCKERNKTTNPVSGTGGVILRITRFVAVVAGVVAVIMIIIGGLRFVMSHGDPQTVNGAKNTILYAVIGLVVIVVAQGIITFVVSKI